MYNHTETRRPELLSPAGDYERLIMAVTYGADAVYLAGREFGMRASAANFDNETLVKGVKFAHARGCRVYVTCNTLPREDELERLPEYLEFLESVGVDALIIADLGVLNLANRYAPRTPKHVSTQLGVINSASASMLYDLGADTAVLARETPLEDIIKIRQHTPSGLKLEAFVHGAMCVSFSGRCLLSNYLTNRDSNRGQCAQPCRWKYQLLEETRPGEYFEITEDSGGYTDPDPKKIRGSTGTYIFNSNDMCMIEHLKELFDAGIDSFKIEGRMKSAYYTATVTNAYRHAIDTMLDGQILPPEWITETEMVSHRTYSTGFYFSYPGQHYGSSSYTQSADIVAVVEECDSDGNAILTQRNRFFTGDILELMKPGSLPVQFRADHIFSENGQELPDTHQAMMRFLLKLPMWVPQYSIVRKKKENFGGYNE